jgi:hypothetical protein
MSYAARVAKHGVSMGRGTYLGGSTVVRNGFGFTPLLDDAGYKPGPSTPTKNQELARERHLIAKHRKALKKVFDLTAEIRRELRNDISRYKRLLKDAENLARLPVPDGYSRGDNVKIISSVIAELERCVKELQ